MEPSEALLQFVEKHAQRQAYCVAYSGGVDSHLLLVLMATLRHSTHPHIRVRAMHVDHGMQEQSAAWADHAERICKALSVPLTVCRCEVRPHKKGLEAAARKARYEQFEQVLEDSEILLLAQHAEDQAETFLLQALRGSGVDGLAGMPESRAFAAGVLARPLLACSKQSILDSAQGLALQWINDPSNQSLDYDRNFLRAKVMPLLQERWPGATKTLTRAASSLSASRYVIEAMAQQDLDRVKILGSSELQLTMLKALPRERVFMAIRLWVRQRGLPMPRQQDLMQVHSDLINARHDSNGIVNVREYEFRSHRDSLYLMLPTRHTKPFHYVWPAPFDDLVIEEIQSTLTADDCLQQGIRLPDSGSVLVKSREGGERIRIGAPAFHKSVKKLLQESAVPPWQRDSVPLIFIDDCLAAVWQLAVASKFKQDTMLHE